MNFIIFIMLSSTLRRNQPTKKSGSTVMFQGDFKTEVQNTIHGLEAFLEKELRASYEDTYVESGRNYVKVRVTDRSE